LVSGSLKAVRIPIQLWRASNDGQVPDAWNTALIRQELPKRAEEYAVPRAGHYAFFPPCSEALAQQAPQVCTDHGSFDRSAFHRDFNRKVVASGLMAEVRISIGGQQIMSIITARSASSEKRGTE
jgi:predicted dienelactone hydrolase